MFAELIEAKKSLARSAVPAIANYNGLVGYEIKKLQAEIDRNFLRLYLEAKQSTNFRDKDRTTFANTIGELVSFVINKYCA